jgi:hypothetical protein
MDDKLPEDDDGNAQVEGKLHADYSKKISTWINELIQYQVPPMASIHHHPGTGGFS